MHKRRQRSDKGKPKYSVDRPPRGPGGRGFRHPVLDKEAFARVIAALGGATKAAAKIGCSYTALGRSAHISHQIAANITSAIATLPDEQQEQARRDWANATLSQDAQQRLTNYFDLMRDTLQKVYAPLWRRVERAELLNRYGQEGGILWNFVKWMNEMPTPVRPARQDAALFRVLEPLFDGIETAWMEVGWKELLRVTDDGEDDSRLVKVLQYGIDREKVLLEVRGPDQERARRLAACAEAQAAERAATTETAAAARERTLQVHREQRIPGSYILGIPGPDAGPAQLG
jgi:hypothetical protein